MMNKRIVIAGLSVALAVSMITASGLEGSVVNAKTTTTSNTKVAADGTRTVTRKDVDTVTGTVVESVTVYLTDGSQTINKTETLENGHVTETLVKVSPTGESESVVTGNTIDGREGIFTGTFDKDGNKTSEAIYKGSGEELYLLEVKTSLSTFSVPDTITVGSKTYKVIEISDEVFKNNKRLTKIEAGKYVRIIGASAFNGDAKLKTIILNNPTTDIDSAAFKGIAKNAVIKIKAGKDDYTKTKKAIIKAGAPKTVKFKRIK